MIQAIETDYAGYRFRSRLEARWAVFFDTIGLDWRYEPEGFRVDTPTGKIKYLPDFWLGSGHWGEVKGYLDLASLNRLYSLAVGMSNCGKGCDMVVFGDVPRANSSLWPAQLHTHSIGQLWAVPWDIAVGCPLRTRPRVAVTVDEATAGHLTDGFPFGVPDWAYEGLSAARRARFEWGEHGR